MRFVTLLILFTFCVQNILPASAEDAASLSGTLLELPALPESIPLEPPTSSGAPIPEASVPVSSALLVRISEVMWMGSDLSTADEWLEITAIPQMTGSVITQPLSLDGWTVATVKDGVETVIVRFGPTHTIASGSFLVAANGTAGQSRLRLEPALVTSGMSLPNTKLLLRLRDGAGQLMDEVDDGIGVPFAGANPSGGVKASMERVSSRLPGNSASSWKTAQTSRGWDSSAATVGTPGYENGSIEPPDTVSPLDVTSLRAFLWSGSLLAAWTPSLSADAFTHELTVKNAGGMELVHHSLTASQTGVSIPLINAALLESRIVDESGHTSTGVSIHVQPLHKPLIDELLPDPPGSDNAEWIELSNAHDVPLDLRGWVLQSGSKSFSLSQSGLILQPGNYKTLTALETGLSLPNAGGEVRLLFWGKTIDSLQYPALPEGVSYGRLTDASIAPLCTAQPLRSNVPLAPSVTVDGFGVPGASTLNLSAHALSGSLAGASCYWDFGDGFTYTGCNPPSHAMRLPGERLITLKVVDYCSTTVLQSYPVFVYGKGHSTIPKKVEPVCASAPSTNLRVSEFLPAPLPGEEEWIEVANTGTGSVSLCGWSIDDEEGGSAPHLLPERALEAGELLLVPSSESRIALNNDQDHVRLIGPLNGGGTGVVMQVAFQQAESDKAYAIRGDGQWLWSPYPTPGSENRFTEVDSNQPQPTVVLHAALPNPKGLDTDSEWIELENRTMRPQWLNGWMLQTSSGKTLSLSGTVLARHELQRIPLKSSFSLGNTRDSLRLVDDQNRIRSVLAWKSVSDGYIVKSYEGPEPLSPTRVTAMEGLTIRSTFVFNHKEELLYLAAQLAGVEVPYDADNSITKNTLSALIKNKKIELKSDSYGSRFYVYADGIDVAPVLLQMGSVFVAGETPFDRRAEYLVYEAEARKNKRGIWSTDEAAAAVDQLRADKAMDALVEKNGLQLFIDPPSSLVTSGSIVRVSSNAPADLFIALGTGSYQSFSGSIKMTADSYVRVFAEYKMRIQSGSIVRSSVATREYIIRKHHYTSCIRISEVYPSPLKGESEWVELMNTCEEEVNLLGWGMDDEHTKGSKLQVFGTGMVIVAHNHMVLSGSMLKIILNNGGDGVSIVMPNGGISDSLWYPSVKKGRAYALKDSQYCLTDTPTPSAPTLCTVKTAIKKVKGKTKKPGIGLKTAFSFASVFLPLENTKTDQIFTLYQGLNAKVIDRENLHIPLASGVLLLAFLCVVMGYWIFRTKR